MIDVSTAPDILQANATATAIGGFAVGKARRFSARTRSLTS
ncbi:hypothetical protein [Chitinophaga sedimenti]|nr:hypothetical protein [Chitinophaga sedimenti]